MQFNIIDKNYNIYINYIELYKNLDRLEKENMLEISEIDKSMYNKIRFKIAKYGKENNKKFAIKYKDNIVYVILKE